LLADPFWLRKINTDLHILADVNIVCPDDRKKVKVKFSLEQATKAQRGSRGIAILFL
jgi:hypothetical protein